MEELIMYIKKLFGIVSQLRADLLYKYAKEAIGTDSSPEDNAPDEYGCVDSATAIIQKVLPFIPRMVSTIRFDEYMAGSGAFQKINTIEPKCIIVSVTGSGNGSIVGHTGIVGKNTAPDGSLWIMSNDSRSGLWQANFTHSSWIKRYVLRGGLKTNYYKLI